MKALITGASSGLGRDMAKYLSNLGWDLIVVARREDRLKDLQTSLKTNVEIHAVFFFFRFFPARMGQKHPVWQVFRNIMLVLDFSV